MIGSFRSILKENDGVNPSFFFCLFIVHFRKGFVLFLKKIGQNMDAIKTIVISRERGSICPIG
jgi:hypothetical protein